MATTSPQKAVVYTKLQSYLPAARKVIVLLQQLLSNDGVKVTLYKDFNKDLVQEPVAIIVVIDARQTRTLITPERGDKNVDHVNELAELEFETSPQASILIVIYGDEKSINLSEDEYIAKEWLQTWRFNDSKAYDLAVSGRIFSLNTNFNKTQEENLRQYFNYVSLTPDVQTNASTIVIGEKCQQQVSSVFNDHPLFRKLSTDETGTETEYGYFHFKNIPEKKEPRFQIDYNTSIACVKVCESGDPPMALRSQLNELNATKYGTTNAGPKGFKTRPPYDNALLSVHCHKCYKILFEQQETVNAELKKAAVVVENDVIPVVSEDEADKVSRFTRNYINKCRKKRSQKNLEDNEVDGEMLLRASILTASHSAKEISYCKKYWRYIIAVVAILILAVLVIIIKTTSTTQPTEHTTVSPINTTITANFTTPVYTTNMTLTNITTPVFTTNITLTNASTPEHTTDMTTLHITTPEYTSNTTMTNVTTL